MMIIASEAAGSARGLIEIWSGRWSRLGFGDVVMLMRVFWSGPGGMLGYA